MRHELESEALGDRSIHLGPIATGSVGRIFQRRCAACDVVISPKDRAVHVYGEVFHPPCAFWHLVSQSDGPVVE